MSATSEIGALNEDAVSRTFERAQSGLLQCLRKGAERVELLGGEVAFFVSVDQTGHAAEVRLEHSTLGDRATEQCMLSVLSRREWPKPVGGHTGVARKSMAFEMPNDVRAPVDWAPDDVAETISGLQTQARTCTGGTGNTFQVTAYIDTNGSPLSVGVASADGTSGSATDCLVAAVMGTKFRSPGSYPAKVSFEL
jgi:hypothetical protein